MTDLEFIEKLNETMDTCEVGVEITCLEDALALVDCLIDKLEDYEETLTKMVRVMKELYEKAEGTNNA